MKGEMIAESSGRMTGIRVMAAHGQDSEIEICFQGQGTVLGVPMRDLGTYVQVTHPGGSIHGHGDVLMMTDDGSTVPWSGFGVGRPLPGGSFTFGVAGLFQGPPDKFARLDTVATVVEYEVEGDDTYRWTMWEWMGGRAGNG